ncbi:hypothetical protein, partial [Vibrio harveyi]
SSFITQLDLHFDKM